MSVPKAQRILAGRFTWSLPVVVSSPNIGFRITWVKSAWMVWTSRYLAWSWAMSSSFSRAWASVGATTTAPSPTLPVRSAAESTREKKRVRIAMGISGGGSGPGWVRLG